MTQGAMGGVRPRLRHDVVFTDTGSGVLVHTGGEGVVVKGAAAYVFAARLAPFLTGERTVDDLCAALPAGRRDSVTAFVRTLLDHGFARDIWPAPRTAVDEDFAAQLSFIEHYRDDAAESLLRFSTAKVLVTGTGPITAATSDSLIRNGLRDVTIAKSTIDIKTPFDAVCLTSGSQPTISSPLVVPLMVHDSTVYLGPAVRSGSTSCPNCLRLWLKACPAGTSAFTEPQAAFVGNALAAELFRQLTGVPAQTTGQIVVIDLKTLESRQERALRHPSCPHCVDSGPMSFIPARTLPEPAAAFQRPDRTNLRALLKELAQSAGSVTGALTGFDDTSVTQSPLKVGRVRLRQGRLITGFDLHHMPVARQRATHAALLAYAGEVASIHDEVGEPPATHVSPEAIVTWSGEDVNSGPPWLPAGSLLSGTRHFVPVSAIHPFSSFNRKGQFDRSSAGDGAAPTVDEAIRRGLLSALAYEALDSSAAELVHLRPSGTDRELEFLVRTADILGLDVELHDLTPGRVCRVVLARSHDPHLVTVAAALSTRAATVSALRDLVGQAQLLGEGSPIDLGNPLMSHPTTPMYSSCSPWTGDAVATRLHGELVARGLDALVVDTTPADVAQLGLVTVRVLLRRTT
jgi:hypothetical protein